MISGQDEVVLAHRIKNGDEKAVMQLVRSNLRFVISVAKQFQHQGVSLGDLINEGNLGLITAAKKFDETKGCKFISYAVWWIRQAIIFAIAEQSRMIHIPYNFVTLKSKVGKAAQKLEQQLYRLPSSYEISIFLNVEEEKVHELYAYDRKQLYIDAPVSRNTETALLDTLPSGDYLADQVTMESCLKKTLRAALCVLNSRDRNIIQSYFGLNCPFPVTLEDIAAQLGLSTEHTRRIKDFALEKLKRSSYGPALKLYLT